MKFGRYYDHQCVFVCLPVHRMSQKVTDGFRTKLCETVDLEPMKKWLNFGTHLYPGSFVDFPKVQYWEFLMLSGIGGGLNSMSAF